MPRPRVDNPETKARILAAAEALFAERGVDGVAVREVATRAEVNTALVHYYFDSKSKLYTSVLLMVAADLAAMALEIAQHKGNAQERLAAYVRGFARVVLRNPNHPRLMYRELMNGAPNLRAALDTGLKPVHLEVLRRIVDDGKAKGEFRDVDASLFPLTLIGMIVQFAIAQPLIDTAVGRVVYDEAFSSRVAEHVIDTLFNGVLAGPPTNKRAGTRKRK